VVLNKCRVKSLQNGMCYVELSHKVLTADSGDLTEKFVVTLLYNFYGKYAE